MKTARIFHLKSFHFWVVKFSIYLNKCVFVMFSINNLCRHGGCRLACTFMPVNKLLEPIDVPMESKYHDDNVQMNGMI